MFAINAYNNFKNRSKSSSNAQPAQSPTGFFSKFIVKSDFVNVTTPEASISEKYRSRFDHSPNPGSAEVNNAPSPSQSYISSPDKINGKSYGVNKIKLPRKSSEAAGSYSSQSDYLTESSPQQSTTLSPRVDTSSVKNNLMDSGIATAGTFIQTPAPANSPLSLASANNEPKSHPSQSPHRGPNPRVSVVADPPQQKDLPPRTATSAQPKTSPRDKAAATSPQSPQPSASASPRDQNPQRRTTQLDSYSKAETSPPDRPAVGQPFKVELASQDPRDSLLSPRFAQEDLRIQWAELIAKSGASNESVLGQGSFGTVIRAIWRPKHRQLEGGLREMDVAVKVISRILSKAKDDAEFAQICKEACEEAKLVFETGALIGNSNHMIKIYGVAEGYLSDSLIHKFRFHPEDVVVGIVMRLETGGSLETLLYKHTDKPLSTVDKMRLLVSVAKGLSEIHAVGVVHGDIKPDNILLSSSNPPEARLADFGMAHHALLGSLGASTLHQTKHLHGTPIYSAPEMLVNPFESEIRIAQASRKTDMYAFALLCWAVLTRSRPLMNIKSEVQLCTKIHSGYRPNTAHLPPEVPRLVISMIRACWDKNRKKRKSAAECFSILHEAYRTLNPRDYSYVQNAHSERISIIEARYDAYVLRGLGDPFVTVLVEQLQARGLSCWYDSSSGDDDGESVMDPALAACARVNEIDNLIYLSSLNPALNMQPGGGSSRESRKAVFVFLDSSSQEGPQADALRLIASSAMVMPVVVFTEEGRDQWMSADIQELCAHPSVLLCDISAALLDNGGNIEEDDRNVAYIVRNLINRLEANGVGSTGGLFKKQL